MVWTTIRRIPKNEFQLLIIGTSKWELAMVVCLSLITQIILKYLASPINRCHPFIGNPLFPICLCKSFVDVQGTYQSTCICFSYTILNDGYNVRCKFWVESKIGVAMCVIVPLSFVPSWKQNHFSNFPLGPYHALFFWSSFLLLGCLCPITCTKGIHQNIALQMRVAFLICEYWALEFPETLHNTIL
jgi:hypothetical protein